MLDFQTIFNNSPAPMCIVHEPDMIITSVNEAFCALFGYFENELLGLNILDDLGYPDDKEESLKFIKANESSYTLTKRYIKKNGNVFWARVKIIKEESEFFGIFEDVSSQKELERLYEMLSRDFDTFAYTASHDLLEPIRSAKNYTDMLNLLYDDFKDNPKAKEAHDVITVNLDLVKKMVDALLSYSRIGTRKIEKKRLSLDTIVEKCKYALQSLIDDKSAQILLDCRSTIFADELHMQKIFQNLIQNALRYSEKPIVQIGCQGQMFWVSDNGVGIEEKYHKVIFKLFKRVDLTEGGLGLGLTEVKRIVELYGGKIWVESELGKGTTFYFTLPKS